MFSAPIHQNVNWNLIPRKKLPTSDFISIANKLPKKKPSLYLTNALNIILFRSIKKMLFPIAANAILNLGVVNFPNKTNIRFNENWRFLQGIYPFFSIFITCTQIMESLSSICNIGLAIPYLLLKAGSKCRIFKDFKNCFSRNLFRFSLQLQCQAFSIKKKKILIYIVWKMLIM